MKQSTPDQKKNADLNYMIAGACALAFSPIFVKLASVGPAIAGFYRMLIGGSILLILVLIKKETLWKGWKPFRIVVLAAFFFSLDLTLWHRSIAYVGPGLATILGNFQVFVLALIGIFFYKERPGWKLIVALPLAMIGLLMIIWGDWESMGTDYQRGVWLGLSTAIMYALFVLCLKASRTVEDPLSPMANMALISTMMMVFFSVEGLIQGQEFVVTEPKTMAALFGYGFLGQVLGWVWVTRGLQSTPASLAGLILLIQPAASFAADVVLFDRPTDLMAYAGASLALIAIYLGTRS